jgi:hypothetical protein
VVAATVLGIGAFGSVASARGVGSAIGRADPFSDEGCFIHPLGYTINTCAATKNWETALVIDFPGTFTPNINYHQPGNTSVQVACDSFALSADGRTFLQTGYVSAPSTSYGGTLTPGSVKVPANGYLFVGCNLRSNSTGNAEIDSITW